MRFERINITADLGTGKFKASRFVKTLVNRLSEVPIANGYYDRVIAGCDVTYLLEGDYETAADGEFFERLIAHLKSAVIVGAEIDGEECPMLAAVKLSLVRTTDSHLGRYTIVLKEI